MPSIHDPTRPQLGPDRPCWMGTKRPLTNLVINSDSPGIWRVGIWLARGLQDATYRHITIPVEDITQILTDWEADPEATLRHYFGLEPPISESGRVESVVRQSADDLGL